MIANWEGAEGVPRSLSTAERRAAMHDRWVQHCRDCMASFGSMTNSVRKSRANGTCRDVAIPQLPMAKSNVDDSKQSSPKDANSTLSAESSDIVDDIKTGTPTDGEVQYRPYALSTSRRIWAISDIHVDFPANMSWLFSLPKKDADGIDYSSGTLILAGDVCHALPMLDTTLRLFKKKFRHVFYCVGNHELWLHATRSTSAPATGRGEPPAKPSFTTDFEDSMEKFFAILNLCRDIGIHTTPAVITADRSDPGHHRDVLIVPLQSWYTPRWVEGSADFRSEKFPMGLQGFDGQCMWPRGVGNPQDARDSLWDSISDFFMTLNSVFLSGVVEFKQRYRYLYDSEENNSTRQTSATTSDGNIPKPEQISTKDNAGVEQAPSSRESDHHVSEQTPGVHSDDASTGTLQRACDSSSSSLPPPPPPRELETISFSHFLPRPELYPVWNKYPATKPLLAVLGCPRLGQAVSSLQSDTHIFGHSHFSMDTRLPLSQEEAEEESSSGRGSIGCDNTTTRYCRFVQQSLAYPHERQRRPKLSSAHEERQRTMPKPVWPSRE